MSDTARPPEADRQQDGTNPSNPSKHRQAVHPLITQQRTSQNVIINNHQRTSQFVIKAIEQTLPIEQPLFTHNRTCLLCCNSCAGHGGGE